MTPTLRRPTPRWKTCNSQRRSAAPAPASAFHEGPINILIVDDEPKNLTVLETILDDPGYRLVRAESADQALLALVAEEFALLILDIRMPGMTGFELAQMIKERKKTAQVPIIFLTAYYNEDQHVLEGYGTGAVDYLHKPVNPAILRSKVAVFAELHRKSRALLAEVTERRRVEEQLRELNETLEQRVTERTQALEIASASLHEAGERYRSLFDGSLDAIFFLDADERFKAANPAALRLITRTLEELKTTRFLDLCPLDQREAVENAFRTAFRCQGFAMDTAVVTVTGERRDLFISGAPEIHDGEVVGISCIARDITERIKTEEALRFSEARYRELIPFSPLPCIPPTSEAASRSTTKPRLPCGGASRMSTRICGADGGRSIDQTAPPFRSTNVRWPSHHVKAGRFAAKRSSSNGPTARGALCCRIQIRCGMLRAW